MFGKKTHNFSLLNKKPSYQFPKGFRVDATGDNFPVMQGLGMSYLKLEVGGIREPHWHPNAHELNYCLSGKALVKLFNPHSDHQTFVLNAGDISFVPMGSLHMIENLGDTPLEMLVCFNNERYEDLSITAAVSVMSDHVMGSTFNVDGQFFAGLAKNQKGAFIVAEKSKPAVSVTENTNLYKLGLASKFPEVNNKGGQVRMSNQFLFPPLDGLAVYHLILEKGGIREPHWHPNAHELNCLMSGSAKITLLSPSGSVETFTMQKGDISFMPRGYFHHIENIGDEPAYYTVFFNNVFPSDIGISGALGSYPNEVLAALFNVAPEYFEKLPKLQQDLLVVSGGA